MRRPEEGARLLGAGVTGDGAACCGCWEPNFCSFLEPQALLSTESPLQSPESLLLYDVYARVVCGQKTTCGVCSLLPPSSSSGDPNQATRLAHKGFTDQVIPHTWFLMVCLFFKLSFVLAYQFAFITPSSSPPFFFFTFYSLFTF